jgi:hypothetical protein
MSRNPELLAVFIRANPYSRQALFAQSSAHDAGDKEQHQANTNQGQQEQSRDPCQQVGTFVLRLGWRDPKDRMTQAHNVKKKVH